MSAYLVRRDLEELRAQLSDRDLAVIESVRRHRFLTALQIQELHFTEHTNPEAAARVRRRVLARLTRERFLARLQRRVGGVRAGSRSFVYVLGTVGGRLLHGTRHQSVEPSPLFLSHTLAIGDAHVELRRADRDGRLQLRTVQIEPECWRRFVGPGGARELVRPDLFVVTAAGAYEDCWFLEIDRGTESPAAISRKCRGYQAYWRTGREQETQRTFPLVVWVVPSEQRATRLERVIAGTRNLKRELFRVTTDAHMIELLAGGAE
jgi:hypothetical protein